MSSIVLSAKSLKEAVKGLSLLSGRQSGDGMAGEVRVVCGRNGARLSVCNLEQLIEFYDANAECSGEFEFALKLADLREISRLRSLNGRFGFALHDEGVVRVDYDGSVREYVRLEREFPAESEWVDAEHVAVNKAFFAGLRAAAPMVSEAKDAMAAKCMMVFQIVPTWLSLIMLVVWYFASANKQIKHVKSLPSYRRKSWKIPLSIAGGALAILMLLNSCFGSMSVNDLQGSWRVDWDTMTDRQVKSLGAKPSKAERELIREVIKAQYSSFRMVFSGNTVSMQMGSGVMNQATFEVVESGSDHITLSIEGRRRKLIPAGWGKLELLDESQNEGQGIILVED